MSSGFFNMKGEPITLREWAELIERGDRTVARDELPSGRWVSTVLIGMDMNIGLGKAPMIFESMVFTEAGSTKGELACRRYSTLEEAKAGHAELVKEWGLKR